MQAQSIKQNTVTLNQSLQIVQTLLRAGFGCVAYLRGLLPDENFTESHLSSTSGVSPSNSQGSNGPCSTSVKLKTIKEGWSTEGDRLLQYLEKGIFDALEKQYLRSFIFAIYLDENDPENLIEAYTFNFSYCDIPGMSAKFPVMTLNDQLDGLSLDNNFTRKSSDPVVQAIRQGKQPTLNELKQSVKYLIRRLIAAVQTLNPLPSRRFVTFKLFYMDGIPDHYEPPYFQPGDSGKQYFFRTHSENEIPEKIRIGSLRTPHHCLNFCIDSISDIISHHNENDGDDSFQYAQVHTKTAGTLSMDKEQMDLQKASPSIRRVVWDAERSVNFVDNPGVECQPTSGIRSKANFEIKETGRGRLMTPHEQTCSPCHPGLAALSPTQVLEANGLMTPRVIPSLMTDASAGLNETEMYMGQSNEVSTQALTEFLLKRDTNKAVSSISTRTAEKKDITGICTTASVSCLTENSEDTDSVINCDCGVHEEEEADVCQCDGPCQNWFHIWCLGHDERLPPSFWCFTCRLRNDPEIEILDSKNLTSQYITKYKDLCLFRRAIKIVLTHRPENVSAFTKLLGAELSTAAQTWKRLEIEGFIVPEIYEGRNKKQKDRRGIKRYKYIPARDIESSQKFKNYFNPTHEALLVGMSKFHLHKSAADKMERSDALKLREQTKPSSTLDDLTVNKRRNDDYDGMSNKRMKVSIAEAINLDE